MKVQQYALLLIAVFYSTAFAQEKKVEDQEPKTKIGAFESRTGSVLIKGMAEIGVVNGSGRVSISVREFTDATTSKKEYGLVIETKGLERFDRETRALIDYDEVDGLLNGIDYVTKIDKSVTKLDDFEAVYRTRDGVKITVFSSSSGKIESAVETGHFSGSTVFLNMQKLGELRELIAQAKARIEAVKA